MAAEAATLGVVTLTAGAIYGFVFEREPGTNVNMSKCVNLQFIFDIFNQEDRL